MLKRTSKVNHLDVKSVSYSGVLQIGDSYQLFPRSIALAVQREQELFYEHEGSFSSYDIFSRQIPTSTLDEQIKIKRQNESAIQVGNISVFGTSASGIVHVGSTSVIDAEARVKHIRQLREDNDIN